jgi:GT2 family glycosyltransferase
MSQLLDKKIINFPINSNVNLTVVIPTMWKASSNYFLHNIEALKKSKVVKKVIIIDNNPQDNYLNINDGFVEVVTNNKNVGVNPAWNQGLEKVDTKYYLLLNDDCLVSPQVIQASVAVLEDDNSVGIVNCFTKKVPIYEYKSDHELLIEYANHLGVNPNGWFIMGHTKDYKPIPKELVYFYGDNFIHYNAVKDKKRVVKVISHFISHDVSTTVNNLDLYRRGLLDSEGEIYRGIIGVKK